MTVEGAADTALVVFVIQQNGANSTFTYDPDTVAGTNPTYNFTRYGRISNINGTTTPVEIEVWYLLNPVASSGSNGGITFSASAGDFQTWGTLLLSGVSASVFRTASSFLGTSNMGDTGTISQYDHRASLGPGDKPSPATRPSRLGVRCRPQARDRPSVSVPGAQASAPVSTLSAEA